MNALANLLRPLRFVLLILLVVGLSGCAAIIRNDGHTQQIAANNELQSLLQSVNHSNYKSLGFQSEAEAAQATLGPSMSVINLSIDKLSQFQPGDEPGRMIGNPDQILYPVVVNGVTRTGIAIKATGPFWYGGGNHSEFVELDTLRADKAVLLGVDKSNFYLLRVAALNEQFLATYSHGYLMLVAVHDDSFAGLKAGEMARAQDVFAKLGGYARQLKNAPKN